MALTAGADCAGVPAWQAVRHCYIITPTTATGRDATITFYYKSNELPGGGQTCAAMEAYHWDGTWDNVLTRDSSYGTGGRMCDADPLSIRVTGVMTFSPFVLRGFPIPEITVEPLSLPFGEQDVDAGPTVSQTVSITNDGTSNLYVYNVYLGGADTGEFVIESDTGEYTLTPGDTRVVQVSFDPTSTGAKSANLTITSNDANEGTITVTLSGTGTGVNNHPVAVDDTFTVDEDSIDNPLDVLGNDSDTDGDTPSIIAVGPPYGGGGTLVNGGTIITYTPLADFYGYETFTYTIGDGNGGFDTATVVVTVNQGVPGNNPPVAEDDAAVTAVGAAANGTTVHSVSVVTYTSDPGFAGTDTFSYTISDGEASDTALVTVTVAQAHFAIKVDDSTNVTLTIPGGCRTDIEAPVGTVMVETDILYNAKEAPSTTPPDHEFVGCAFTLDAYQGGVLQDDFVFEAAISATLTYEETSVTGLNLDSMQLFAQDDGSNEWSTDGITRESLDPVSRRHTSQVARLTLFALFAQPEPALNVFKSVDTGGLDPVPLGSVVTYTLVISNSTDDVAMNVVLTDPLPSGVTFGDWVMYGGSALLPPPGTVNLPPVTVEWSPGDVAAGTAYTLSFTAHVVTDTQFAGQTVDNVAYVVADNAPLDSGSASFDIEGGGVYIYLPLVLRNG